MRLSDAAMLGSLMQRYEVRDWNSCFLGLAANAVGVPRVSEIKATTIAGMSGEFACFDVSGRIEGILAHWPWLASNENEHMYEITHLFDHGMPFDKLVEYVRTIEPPCECGVRECCCARMEYLLDVPNVPQVLQP